MQRTRLILSVLILAILGAGVYMIYSSSNGNAKEKMDDLVLAEINDKKIYKSDVEDFVSTLPPQISTAPLEQIYPMVMEQVINGELVLQKAKEAKLQNDKEVEKRLKNAKDQIIRTVYIERQLKKRTGDEKLKAEYERLKKESSGRKETRARHILVEKEEDAKAIIKDLESGQDFAELAKKMSVGPTGPRGGDLGYFTEEAMVPEFAKVAFELKPGTYSKTPVKTQFGWHVIRVEDRRDVKVPPFAAVKDQLQAQLQQQALEGIVNELRAEANIKQYSLTGEPVK